MRSSANEQKRKSVDSPSPEEKRLERVWVLGTARNDRRDITMLPLIVKRPVDPSLPVGKDPVFALESFSSAPSAGPVPRCLGLCVVLVVTLGGQFTSFLGVEQADAGIGFAH